MCHTRSADSEYSASTVSVPHAAIRSHTSMMRFLSHWSASVPPMKRRTIVGRNAHSVSSATLDAVPRCP